MTRVWDTPCRNCTAKLVLVALADNANDQGFCFPGIEHLASKCDLSLHGIRLQIKKLEEDGLLRVERSQELVLHTE